MVKLPFNLILMRSAEWEKQVNSRINRALNEVVEAMVHSPDGFNLELQPGMTAFRMCEIIATLSGRRRVRRGKTKKEVLNAKE